MLKNKIEKDKKGLEKIKKNENNVNVTLGNDTEENKKENNRLENKKKDSSKKSYSNYEQREYPPEFFEGIYDNLRK